MKKRGRPKGQTSSYEKRKFYVFYDEKDNVRLCGTAEQLVEEGHYSSVSSFHSVVNHINNSKNQGKVVILR